MSYARIVEEEVQVLRWSVECPDHGELLVMARDRGEAEDIRFAHNVAHHPGSLEARLTNEIAVYGDTP